MAFRIDRPLFGQPGLQLNHTPPAHLFDVGDRPALGVERNAQVDHLRVYPRAGDRHRLGLHRHRLPARTVLAQSLRVGHLLLDILPQLSGVHLENGDLLCDGRHIAHVSFLEKVLIDCFDQPVCHQRVRPGQPDPDRAVWSGPHDQVLFQQAGEGVRQLLLVWHPFEIDHRPVLESLDRRAALGPFLEQVGLLDQGAEIFGAHDQLWCSPRRLVPAGIATRPEHRIPLRQQGGLDLVSLGHHFERPHRQQHHADPDEQEQSQPSADRAERKEQQPAHLLPVKQLLVGSIEVSGRRRRPADWPGRGILGQRADRPQLNPFLTTGRRGDLERDLGSASTEESRVDKYHNHRIDADPDEHPEYGSPQGQAGAALTSGDDCGHDDRQRQNRYQDDLRHSFSLRPRRPAPDMRRRRASEGAPPARASPRSAGDPASHRRPAADGPNRGAERPGVRCFDGFARFGADRRRSRRKSRQDW